MFCLSTSEAMNNQNNLFCIQDTQEESVQYQGLQRDTCNNLCVVVVKTCLNVSNNSFRIGCHAVASKTDVWYALSGVREILTMTMRGAHTQRERERERLNKNHIAPMWIETRWNFQIRDDIHQSPGNYLGPSILF